MIKLKVQMEDEVFDALFRMAAADLRPMGDEIAFLLREALKKRGFLPPESVQERDDSDDGNR